MVYVYNIGYMDIVLFNVYVIYEILRIYVNVEEALEMKQSS